MSSDKTDNPRYRGLRPNPQTLGVIPLEAGELSKPVRVRAPGWVHDRLADLTAAQIGELISTALRANDSALHVTKIDSALHGSGLIITNSALRENDSALQAEASLHVTPEPDAPLSLLVFRRAELSAPQTDLVDALSAGATLKRDLDAAAWILTLKDGTAQRVPTNTVTALQRKGVLST